MRADMARHDAGEQIVSAARRRADDEADLLAAVEVFDVVGGVGRGGGEERQKQREKTQRVIPGSAKRRARNP